jgi:hypothetical protein
VNCTGGKYVGAAVVDRQTSFIGALSSICFFACSQWSEPPTRSHHHHQKKALETPNNSLCEPNPNQLWTNMYGKILWHKGGRPSNVYHPLHHI